MCPVAATLRSFTCQKDIAVRSLPTPPPHHEVKFSVLFFNWHKAQVLSGKYQLRVYLSSDTLPGKPPPSSARPPRRPGRTRPRKRLVPPLPGVVQGGGGAFGVTKAGGRFRRFFTRVNAGVRGELFPVCFGYNVNKPRHRIQQYRCGTLPHRLKQKSLT
jgi:hypothetical protein